MSSYVSLRILDVADDLAFLVMNLAALGSERLGSELVEAYRDAGGDCGDDSLLAFVAVHRALVRAKVLFLRARQKPVNSAGYGRASTEARELLAAVQELAWCASGWPESSPRDQPRLSATARSSTAQHTPSSAGSPPASAGSRGALVDATFRHHRDRDTFAQAFADRTPRDPCRVSDATLSVVLSAQVTWEPPEEVQGDRQAAVLVRDRPRWFA